MVTVKVFGTLSLDLGITSLELDLAGGTLADLIEQMANRYGTKVKEELMDKEGNLDYAYGIFCAGEKLNYLSTRIRDGAELVIVNMLGGG